MEDMEKLLKGAEAKQTPPPPAADVELTEDLIEKAIEKRFGVKSDQLVKKGTEVKVLTIEEEQELQKQKKESAFKKGIEENWFGKEQYDNFLLDSQKSEVERAREKFIADNPEIEDAGDVFDETFKVNEEDELEDGENKIPNKAKLAAAKLVKKIADEELQSKYKDVIGALPRFEKLQQEQAVREKNTAIVTGVLAAMPPRIETEIDGVKFGIAVLPEDLEAATTFANQNEVLLDNELNESDLKTNVATHLLVRNMKRILAEVKNVSFQSGRSSAERGAKNLDEETGDGSGVPLSDAQKLIQDIKNSS